MKGKDGKMAIFEGSQGGVENPGKEVIRDGHSAVQPSGLLVALKGEG